MYIEKNTLCTNIDNFYDLLNKISKFEYLYNVSLSGSTVLLLERPVAFNKCDTTIKIKDTKILSEEINTKLAKINKYITATKNIKTIITLICNDLFSILKDRANTQFEKIDIKNKSSKDIFLEQSPDNKTINTIFTNLGKTTEVLDNNIMINYDTDIPDDSNLQKLLNLFQDFINFVNNEKFQTKINTINKIKTDFKNIIDSDKDALNTVQLYTFEKTDIETIITDLKLTLTPNLLTIKESIHDLKNVNITNTQFFDYYKNLKIYIFEKYQLTL